MGRIEDIKKLGELLAHGFGPEYKRQYPDAGDHARLAFQQSVNLMETIAQGRTLPPSEHTLSFEKIVTALKNPEVDPDINENVYFFRNDRFARIFKWELGDLFPERAGETDLDALYAMIGSEKGFNSVTVRSLFSPEIRTICGMEFSALFWNPQDDVTEHGTTLLVPHDISPGTLVLADWETTLDLGVNLFAHGPERPIRMDIEEDRSRLAILDESRNWRSYYHLMDHKDGKYFFSREKPSTGEPTSDSSKEEQEDFSLNPGLLPEMG